MTHGVKNPCYRSERVELQNIGCLLDCQNSRFAARSQSCASANYSCMQQWFGQGICRDDLGMVCLGIKSVLTA